ncbi:MAG: PQQ-dependent sugar dehydrogenase [Betaproteobacteria bacterium]
MRSAVLILLFIGMAFCANAAAAERVAYRTSGLCDGLPRIQLKTPPGVCVGLVASGLRFPRGVLPLDNGDLLVVAMGGWEAQRGSVWLLKRRESGFEQKLLVDKLDRPHGIALGPDGRVYIGVVGGVLRFNPLNPRSTLEPVVGGGSDVSALPESGRHPLVNLVFDQKGYLYVGVGSHSDNCEAHDGSLPDSARSCAEAEGENPRGSIRRYRMKWPEGAVLGSEMFARGLRNSMALAVHPVSGILLQGENSRDAIHRHMPDLENDEELPHDELNVIESGKHYGWPYCYDQGRPSPEYPDVKCAKFEAPSLLLPAHAAPLGMTFYSGGLLPIEYHGSLLISFHGYRRHGHRVVAYAVDANGSPVGSPRDLVWGWEAGAGGPKGTPVDLRTGTGGAVYLTEDRNGTVLRIAQIKN